MVALLTGAKEPLRFRIHEKEYTSSEPLGAYQDAQLSFPRKRIGKGKIVVAGNHRHAQDLMAAAETTVPITCDVNGVEWTGRVMDTEFTGPGNETLTCYLESDYNHLASWLAWPSNFMPLAAQMPPQDMRIGNLETVLKGYMRDVARREGLPVSVAPNRGILTNRINLSARMDPLDELFDHVLANSTGMLTVNPWRPGMAQPWEGAARVDPTLIFDVKEMRDRRQDIQWSTEGGGISAYTIKGKHPRFHTAIVGGKSPDFLNVLVREGISLMIGAAFAAAGLGFISTGIGSLLENILFAFDKYVNHDVKAATGKFGLHSGFISATSALSADSLQQGTQGLMDAAGGRSAQFEVVAGKPHQFGTDAFHGRPAFQTNDYVRFRRGGEILEDFISDVVVRDNKRMHRNFTVTVGDDRIAQDPLAQMIGDIQGAISFARMINLSA